MPAAGVRRGNGKNQRNHWEDDSESLMYPFLLQSPEWQRRGMMGWHMAHGALLLERDLFGEIEPPDPLRSTARTGGYELFLGDSLHWLQGRRANSIHAIVTDPPYGLREYSEVEKRKLRSGRGGVWRIPPSFDGCRRKPVPRFTVLDHDDRRELRNFFERFAREAIRVLVPGGHIFVATNPLLSHLVYLPMMEAGLEKRGEIIRLVRTLRGGDRPKNAHVEFSDVSVMPRSGWEPWGLFRKPCEGRVQDNLRKWKAGGLRRISGSEPFCDVIEAPPARAYEKTKAPHPSLKPQALMRQIVRASLPLGVGTVLDPFMGAGSTIAACVALGYEGIGVEIDPAYFAMAEQAIPALARLGAGGRSPANRSDKELSDAASKGPQTGSHKKGGRFR
jgi:site-specific DNA-methyltransferase (adenine-specific)